MYDYIWTNVQPTEAAMAAGVRFGHKGIHTTRTMMLTELSELLRVVPPGASRSQYATAIVEDNVLGKGTTATRRGVNQRLGELYALDPGTAVFRVLRRLWDMDDNGRPILALLCALARDPLLRSTAPVVLALQPGEELLRSKLIDSIKCMAGERLNAATIDKVARNASSSWTQAGHLVGRAHKIRQMVSPTAGSLAFALWLGSLWGLVGAELLRTPWVGVFDRTPEMLIADVLQARKTRLIDARVGGQVVEIDPRIVDPMGGR